MVCPVLKENSTKNTVLAAIEMSEFILNRSKERQQEGKVAFEMRTGIHTGPVIAGIVGTLKFQYDLWGDTVNTASRMESHSEVGKVNISHHTHELIENEPEFIFEPRGSFEVKGKGEVEMYFVIQSARKVTIPGVVELTRSSFGLASIVSLRNRLRIVRLSKLPGFQSY